MALDREKVPLKESIEAAMGALIETEVNGPQEGEEEKALVVDTYALAAILKYELQGLMLKLCGACVSVICARVSPKQKAKVVEMVRAREGGSCHWKWLCTLSASVIVLYEQQLFQVTPNPQANKRTPFKQKHTTNITHTACITGEGGGPHGADALHRGRRQRRPHAPGNGREGGSWCVVSRVC
jgi:hypothetical protein